jgi:tetratricopeptide (TPR) repeat protein
MSKPLNKVAALLIASTLLSGCGAPSTTVRPDMPEPEAKPEKKAEQPRAKKSARKAVPLPKSAKAAYDRAIWSAQAGRNDEAISLFKQMTQQYPDTAIGYTNLGLLYLNKGETESAQNALEQSLALDPSDALAYNHLGVAYREQGKFTESQTAYLQAIKLDAAYSDAYLNLGILYDLYLQQLAKALQQYKRYQELNGGTDQTVAKWIVDLERRAGAKK